MKYAISILKRRGALIAAVLAAIVLTVTAGAAFAYDYTSAFNSAGKVLTVDDFLPLPDISPTPYTTERGGLYKLVSGDQAPLSSDHFSPGWANPGQSNVFTGIKGLTVTAKAAPGGGGKNAYVDGGFLTNEDIFFIGQRFTDLVSLDLSSATVGARSGDFPWLGNLDTLFQASSTKIQSIKLPKGLKTVSADAFKSVDIKLAEIVFNEDLGEIGDNAFNGAIHSNGAVIAFTGGTPPKIAGSSFPSSPNLTFVTPKNSGYDAIFGAGGALAQHDQVHATVTAPRFEKAALGKTVSKPVSVDYDGAAAVSFNMTVDSDKFKITKSADDTVVNGKTNAEWQIGPAANIPGHHEDKIKVVFSNGALAYAAVSADVIEAAPTAVSIDYAAERLAGFTANVSYDITYGAVTEAQYKADGSGYIPVNEGWFGKTISMVKVNADKSLNSDKAELSLPKRPDVPSAAIITEASSLTAKDGGLTVTSKFPAEYRPQGDTNWTPVSPDNKVTGLAAKTYEVRVKGDNNSSRFPSRIITAIVTVKGSPSPNLNVAAMDFAPKVIGYGEIAPLNLIISNNGNANAVITGVISDSTDFTVSAGSADVTADGQNTSWTVQPIKGLAAGEHRTNISVNYNYGKASAGDVSFMVYAAPKIEKFSIKAGDVESSGAIDEKSHTITATVPHGSDLTKLVPTITFIGESVTPDSGVAQDFTSAVTYTVEAYGKETAYTVKVNADSKQAGTLVDGNYRSWKASASKGKDDRYTFEIDIPLAPGLDASKINSGSLTVNGMTALAADDVVFDGISLNANLHKIFIFGTASNLSLVKLSSLSYKLLGDDVTVYTQTFDREISFNDIPRRKHNSSGGCDAGSGAAAIALACAAALAIRGRRG